MSITSVHRRSMIFEAIFREFSRVRFVTKKLFSVGTHRKLLGTLKRESVDRTGLSVSASSWQLLEEETSSYRTRQWIPASKFLALSDVFLRDPAQTSRPRYIRKYRVAFDIKVSATRLKLRQEKSFPSFLDPASKIR